MGFRQYVALSVSEWTQGVTRTTTLEGGIREATAKVPLLEERCSTSWSSLGPPRDGWAQDGHWRASGCVQSVLWHLTQKAKLQRKWHHHDNIGTNMERTHVTSAAVSTALMCWQDCIASYSRGLPQYKYEMKLDEMSLPTEKKRCSFLMLSLKVWWTNTVCVLLPHACVEILSSGWWQKIWEKRDFHGMAFQEYMPLHVGQYSFWRSSTVIMLPWWKLILTDVLPMFPRVVILDSFAKLYPFISICQSFSFSSLGDVIFYMISVLLLYHALRDGKISSWNATSLLMGGLVPGSVMWTANSGVHWGGHGSSH